MWFWVYIISLVVIVLAVWLVFRSQEKKWEKEKLIRMAEKTDPKKDKNTFDIEDAIFSPNGVHKVLLDRLYGENVELRSEPDNQYDGNAVQVVWEDEHGDEFVLGYLFRGRLQDKVNEYMRAGREADMLGFISEVIVPEQSYYEEKKCLRITVVFKQ